MLKPHALGLAAAVITGVCYMAESVLFYLWPAQTLDVYGMLAHNLDFAVLEGEAPTFTNFFLGLAVWLVVAYVSCYFFAWLYNRFAK